MKMFSLLYYSDRGSLKCLIISKDCSLTRIQYRIYKFSTFFTLFSYNFANSACNYVFAKERFNTRNFKQKSCNISLQLESLHNWLIDHGLNTRPRKFEVRSRVVHVYNWLHKWNSFLSEWRHLYPGNMIL